MHYSTRFAPETTRAAIVTAYRQGVSARIVAARFRVSLPTVYRWAKRESCSSRSSRPARQPRKSSPELELHVRQVREQTRRGPAYLALALGMPASTVYKILVRLGINTLAPQTELPPSGPRYEYAKPGGMLHVDVKKLHRLGLVGRLRGPGECLHVMLDDHSRAVYTETQADESAPTASAFIEHGVAWFASLGVRCERVLTDNHPTYRSLRWRDTCQLLGLRALHTRPRRPQTNGKCERWNRTLMDEAIRGRVFASQQARACAIENWVNDYNAHRPHTAISGKAPLQQLLSSL